MSASDTPSVPTVQLEHWFIHGQNYCQHCGMTLADVRTEGVYRMLTEAFDRLAAVLERLEAKGGL